MRKLMYVTLGFAVSCGLCAWILPKENIQTAMYVALFFAALMLIFAGRYKLIARFTAVMLGCAAGFFWFLQYDGFYLSHAAALDGMTKAASIRAADYSYETDYGIACDGTITIEDKTYQVKAYLDDLEAVEPGNVITGDFRLRVTTPDGAEKSTYHPGKGIFLIAYQQGDVILSQAQETWQDSIARLRLKIKTMLHAAFPSDTYPFAIALLLGDGGELDYATDTDFKLSGIRHVIAVSGLHVSILFALISAVTLRKRFLTVLLGFPALFLFAALAGFTPSVVRACLMSGLMLLSMLLNKEYDGATGLAFASLVMLILNPLVITSVSFQLSVGSVAGIYLFQTPIRQWILSRFSLKKEQKFRKRVVNWFASSIAITVSAMTITTPLCAFYFGTVSLVGILTNLLTLWVISFLFYGILAVCLTSFFSGNFAGLLAYVISLPIRYVLVTAGFLADFPLASVYIRSPYIVAWLILVYILLVSFLIMKRKQPAVLICCGILGLCVSLLASWAEPMLSDVHFTVLDVGQGQCLMLQAEGKTYMVDCGGDGDATTADIAAETLLSQGITKLDGLILTHLDRDHAGAAENLLSRVDTKLLILPPEETGLADKTKGEVLYASQDLSLTCGSMEVRIFAPLFPGNSNEMSLCILFDTEKCDILITGDRNGFGERSLLRHSIIPDVDILVAGHHGSRNSTCEELLQAVRPEIVCISVGEENSYGHPAPELLQRLQDYSCTVYRTDIQGDILIRR